MMIGWGGGGRAGGGGAGGRDVERTGKYKAEWNQGGSSDTPWHNQNEAQLSSDPLQGGERVSKYISKLVFYAQPLRLYQGKLAREGTRLTVVSTEEEDLQISLG